MNEAIIRISLPLNRSSPASATPRFFESSMPWFWRTSTSKSPKTNDPNTVRVTERQVSRGSSFSSFISRRSAGSSDLNWERESAGIELQPPSHSLTTSEESTFSMPANARQTRGIEAEAGAPPLQSSALMVAELEVEEPPAPVVHHEEKKKSGGILNTGWRPRGNSIVSLKAIGRKKSNSVSTAVPQTVEQHEPSSTGRGQQA